MAPMLASSDESVRVVVQARPLLPFEIAHNATETVTTTSTPPQVTLNRPLTTPAIFNSFDAVYSLPCQTPPDELYQAHVSPLVDGLFQGFNATVFAYGQTSAGKSYTMSHITTCVAQQLFNNKLMAEKTGQSVNIRIGFVEIYRERIRDLVDGARAPLGTVDIQVRERRASASGKREIFLDGARERPVADQEELMDLVKEACLVRQTAATGMNASSSRSHSVITITVHQTHTSENDNGEKKKMDSLAAKLHLVDLAGSERAKRTATAGTRFNEGVDINRGLFALAKVISALANNANKKKGSPRSHIPYRDSKLTRLLQDSLGGNARTLLVACISPADTSREETLGTLRYAEQAKCIRNKPKVNTEVNSVEVSDLRAALARAKAEIASLVAENERLRGRSRASIRVSNVNGCENRESEGEVVNSMRVRISQLEEEVQFLRENEGMEQKICSPSRLRSGMQPRRFRSDLGVHVLDEKDDNIKESPSSGRSRTLNLPRRRVRVEHVDDYKQIGQKQSMRTGFTKKSKGSGRDMEEDTESPNEKVQFGTRSVSEISLTNRSKHQPNQKIMRRPQRFKVCGPSVSTDSFLYGYDESEDSPNRSGLDSNVVNALSTNRMMEMRRTFMERLRQAESDKSVIDGERSKLLRKICTLEQKHEKEFEELKASHQSRIGDMRKKLADVKRLEAESTRLMKLRGDSDAEHKKLLSRAKAAEKTNNELNSKLADALAKTDIMKRALGKENRDLVRSERQIRMELARTQGEKMKQTAIISRLRVENDTMRNRLRSGGNNRQQMRRANSSITPRALAHTTTC